VYSSRVVPPHYDYPSSLFFKILFERYIALEASNEGWYFKSLYSTNESSTIYVAKYLTYESACEYLHKKSTNLSELGVVTSKFKILRMLYSIDKIYSEE